jgi:hypothetical protein
MNEKKKSKLAYCFVVIDLSMLFQDREVIKKKFGPRAFEPSVDPASSKLTHLTEPSLYSAPFESNTVHLDPRLPPTPFDLTPFPLNTIQLNLTQFSPRAIQHS